MTMRLLSMVEPEIDGILDAFRVLILSLLLRVLRVPLMLYHVQKRLATRTMHPDLRLSDNSPRK